MFTRTSLAVLLVAICPCIGVAQSIKGLEAGARVRTMSAGRQFTTGSLERIDRDSITMRSELSGAVFTIPMTEVKKVQVSAGVTKTSGAVGRGIAGFFLGAAGGGAIGAFAMRSGGGCSNNCFGPSNSQAGAFFGAILGGLVGAGVGASSGQSEKWTDVDPPR